MVRIKCHLSVGVFFHHSDASVNNYIHNIIYHTSKHSYTTLFMWESAGDFYDSFHVVWLMVHEFIVISNITYMVALLRFQIN